MRHGICRLPLDLGGDVGIGVQGKARAVVAQHPGDGLDIHTVLQSYRGERISHIVESNPGQSNLFQHPVEHVEHAVRRDETACRRGEHILTVGFSPLVFENLHRILPDGHASIGVFRFQRSLYHLAIDPGDLAAHLNRASLQVDVLPLEAQQLAAPQPDGQLDIAHLEHAARPGFVAEEKCWEAAEEE